MRFFAYLCELAPTCVTDGHDRYKVLISIRIAFHCLVSLDIFVFFMISSLLCVFAYTLRLSQRRRQCRRCCCGDDIFRTYLMFFFQYVYWVLFNVPTAFTVHVYFGWTCSEFLLPEKWNTQTLYLFSASGCLLWNLTLWCQHISRSLLLFCILKMLPNELPNIRDISKRIRFASLWFYRCSNLRRSHLFRTICFSVQNGFLTRRPLFNWLNSMHLLHKTDAWMLTLKRWQSIDALCTLTLWKVFESGIEIKTYVLSGGRKKFSVEIKV